MLASCRKLWMDLNFMPSVVLFQEMTYIMCCSEKDSTLLLETQQNSGSNH